MNSLIETAKTLQLDEMRKQPREMENKIKETNSLDHAGKLIYQWVKENRISPGQMTHLTVLAYKLHG